MLIISYFKLLSDNNISNTKIIEKNGREVGYLVLKETLNDIYIENLLIENQSQNLGMGKSIMEKIIERLNYEKKFIRLQVFKINIKAQKFYKNLGFEINLETKNHIEMKKTGNSIVIYFSYKKTVLNTFFWLI